MNGRSTSLRLRLTLMMGALFLAGMIALYAAARSYAGLAADRSFDRLLSGSAESIVDSLSVIEGEILVDLPYSALDMLSAAPNDRVFYRVLDPRHQTVTGYSDLPPVPPQWRTPVPSVAQDTRFFDAFYRGERVRFVLVGRPVAQPGSRGWVWVQVGQTNRGREAFAQELVLAALAPIALMTLLAVSIVWFGINRALRPLHALGEELSSRQPSNLRALQAPVPSEIAPVIHALNVFMHRLGDNIGRMRDLIGDVAHQLRTPLAGMLAQAQISAEGDVHELRESMGKIERSTIRMTRLINQLLSDATIHHRAEVRKFESFDLVELLRDAIYEVVPQSEDSDVRFTSHVPRASMVGDPLMLGEAVKNLVHNALRHGRGEHAEVHIELTERDQNYELAISDRGPGIAPEDRERVFERFARGSSTAPGAGLGLPIVQQAVEAHSGTVRLHDRDGGGLTVLVLLPRATE